MYSFVVLGQIPGTSITISFTMWVQLALILLATGFWYKHTRKQKVTTQEHPVNIMVMRGGKLVPVNEIAL